jgi:hypothetical protein
MHTDTNTDRHKCVLRGHRAPTDTLVPTPADSKALNPRPPCSPVMTDWQEQTLSVTFALLAGSVVLIVPGLAGLGASLPLLVAVLGVGVSLATLRRRLAELPPLMGQAVGPHARDLWVGPVVAVLAVFVVEPSATAGELQSIGGLLGFVGMVNYFLRPLYLFLFGLAGRLLPNGHSG